MFSDTFQEAQLMWEGILGTGCSASAPAGPAQTPPRASATCQVRKTVTLETCPWDAADILVGGRSPPSVIFYLFTVGPFVWQLFQDAAGIWAGGQGRWLPSAIPALWEVEAGG